MSDHPLSVLLVVILICPSVMAIEDDEVAYLQRFGYVTEDLSTAMISGNFWSDKIKAFQDMADVPQTGEMDLATKQAMKATRCGVPDKTPSQHGHSHRHRHRRLRVKRQYSVYKWPRNELTYWIRNTARSLRDRQAVRREIAEAFRAWSDVSGLTFREVESDDGRDVDIALSFEHGSHGCPSPFARGYLAHAFKYTERYQFSGDVHFNDDYMFKSSPVSNYLNRLEIQNLRSVAMHEIGHSLGIDHQNSRNSIMFYSYQHTEQHPKLSSHDILLIQRLYGPKGNTRNPENPPEPPRSPSRGHDNKRTSALCTSAVDAAVIYRGELLLFSGSLLWRFRNDQLVHGPIEATQVFRDLPPSIEAALHVDDQLYFFSGQRVHIYRETRPVSILSLSYFGLPHQRIRLAFSSKSRYYIWGDVYFWELDPRTLKVKHDRKAIHHVWSELPGEASAAYETQHGVNFLARNMVYEYQEASTPRGRPTIRRHVSVFCGSQNLDRQSALPPDHIPEIGETLNSFDKIEPEKGFTVRIFPWTIGHFLIVLIISFV